ncbi:MAG: hypothetical protein KIT39_12645 [Nitrospirales bacterium]|nr:hypothetical protein [Nitrospirales bacterium]
MNHLSSSEREIHLDDLEPRWLAMNEDVQIAQLFPLRQRGHMRPEVADVRLDGAKKSHRAPVVDFMPINDFDTL